MHSLCTSSHSVPRWGLKVVMRWATEEGKCKWRDSSWIQGSAKGGRGQNVRDRRERRLLHQVHISFFVSSLTHYFKGPEWKKAADILLGQKQLLSVQYSFERGQQVGKLHLLECIDSMQGIWMNATFWHKITETHSVTKPYSRKIALWEWFPSVTFPVFFFIFFNLMLSLFL